MRNKFADAAKAKSELPRKECIPYITKDDTSIKYDWFTQEEFQKAGYIQLNLSGFTDHKDE